MAKRKKLIADLEDRDDEVGNHLQPHTPFTHLSLPPFPFLFSTLSPPHLQPTPAIPNTQHPPPILTPSHPIPHPTSYPTIPSHRPISRPTSPSQIAELQEQLSAALHEGATGASVGTAPSSQAAAALTASTPRLSVEAQKKDESAAELNAAAKAFTMVKKLEEHEEKVAMERGDATAALAAHSHAEEATQQSTQASTLSTMQTLAADETEARANAPLEEGANPSPEATRRASISREGRDRSKSTARPAGSAPGSAIKQVRSQGMAIQAALTNELSGMEASLVSSQAALLEVRAEIRALELGSAKHAHSGSGPMLLAAVMHRALRETGPLLGMMRLQKRRAAEAVERQHAAEAQVACNQVACNQVACTQVACNQVACPLILSARCQMETLRYHVEKERNELQLALGRQAEHEADWARRRERILSVDPEELASLEIAELLVTNQFLQEKNDLLQKEIAKSRAELSREAASAQVGGSGP